MVKAYTPHCPKYSFILCKTYSDACKDKMPENDCILKDLFSAFPKERVEDLAGDKQQRGEYSLTLDDHLEILGEIDNDVDFYHTEKGHMHIPFRRLFETFGKPKQIRLGAEDKNLPYHLRASEKGCVLERITAKLEKKNLPFETDNFFSRVGEVDHFIFNRKQEDTIYYTCPDGLTLKGHPDAIFRFGNSNDVIGIIDKKRTQVGYYEQIAIVKQCLTYAMGVAKMIGANPKHFLLISVKAPYQEKEGQYRFPKYNMTAIPNDLENPRIKEFHEEAEKSYEEQVSVLDSREYFFEIKEKMSSNEKKGCRRKIGHEHRECFSKKFCDFLTAHMEENCYSTLGEVILKLDEKYKLIPKGLQLFAKKV